MDSSCPSCLNVFETPHLLVPCGHTLCAKCITHTKDGVPYCQQCGDFDARTFVPNRVVDSIAVRYQVRSSYVGQLKYVLRELYKPSDNKPLKDELAQIEQLG